MMLEGANRARKNGNLEDYLCISIYVTLLARFVALSYYAVQCTGKRRMITCFDVVLFSTNHKV